MFQLRPQKKIKICLERVWQDTIAIRGAQGHGLSAIATRVQSEHTQYHTRRKLLAHLALHTNHMWHTWVMH